MKAYIVIEKYYIIKKGNSKSIHSSNILGKTKRHFVIKRLEWLDFVRLCYILLFEDDRIVFCKMQ